MENSVSAGKSWTESHKRILVTLRTNISMLGGASVVVRSAEGEFARNRRSDVTGPTEPQKTMEKLVGRKLDSYYN